MVINSTRKAAHLRKIKIIFRSVDTQTNTICIFVKENNKKLFYRLKIFIFFISLL